MSIAWVAEQIRAATAGHGVQPPGLVRFNPKPPGQPQPGGATEAVIHLLAKSPDTFFTHGQIHAACDSFGKCAVDWALIRLRDWKAIETTPDAARNPRFLRYRLVKVAI
jgi:hypothetical protein